MKKQKGFAHALLIIGLMVALIGAIVFIVWQNYIHEEPEADAVKTEQTQTASNPNDKSESVDGKTLTISELQIKFTLNDNLEDLTYGDYKSNGPNLGSVVFTSSEMAKYCSLGKPDAPLGALFKVKGKYKAEPDGPELIKQYESYFVAYRQPQQVCTASQNDEQQVYEISSKQVPLIKKSLESISPL